MSPRPVLGQAARGHAREPHAIAGHVGLVGIAEIGRDAGQIGVSGRDRGSLSDQPPEAEYPVECLRAVADRAMKSAPQLSLADSEGVSELIDAAPREAEPSRRGEYEWVGRGLRESGRDQPLQHQMFTLGVSGGVEPLGQLGTPCAEQFLERNLEVEDLAGRRPEHGTGNAGAQPDPHDPLTRPDRTPPRRSVDSRDAHLAVTPDQIDTAIGQHQR